jgi:chaperonin GroES
MAAKKPKFRPILDNVLIRPDKAEEKKGSIIIPEQAQEQSTMGEVIAIGPGALDKNGKRIPMDVEEGDRVVFNRHGGDEIELEGEQFLLSASRYILAVIE